MGDAPHQLALAGGRAEADILLLGGAALRQAEERDREAVGGRARRAVAREAARRATAAAAAGQPELLAALLPAPSPLLDCPGSLHGRLQPTGRCSMAWPGGCGCQRNARTLGAIVKGLGRQGQRSCRRAGGRGGLRRRQRRRHVCMLPNAIGRLPEHPRAGERPCRPAPSTWRCRELACASFRRMACKGESAERPGQAMPARLSAGPQHGAPEARCTASRCASRPAVCLDRRASPCTKSGMAWTQQPGRLQAASVSSSPLRAPCRAAPPQHVRDSSSMFPWLLQLTSWLRGGHARPAAAGAAAPAALSSSDQAAGEAAAAAKPEAEHLIVMVHGLFGTRDNWRAIRQLLEEHLDRRATALFVSHCNERQKTFDGIDTCGERLAEEIREVAAQHPRLRRISILSHSMGGLIRWEDELAGCLAGCQAAWTTAWLAC